MTHRFVCHHCPATVEYGPNSFITELQGLFFLQLRAWNVIWFEHTAQVELVCHACRLRLGEIKPYVKAKSVKRCKVCRAPQGDCGCRS